MADLVLYGITVLIWGTSWIAISYQLGVVAPEVSVVYRFATAAAVLVIFCGFTGRTMRFRLTDHALFAIQGTLLFGLNYALIYLATEALPSGMVSVVFSTIVITNMAGGTLLLGMPVSRAAVVGALLGLAGMVAVFWPEISTFDATRGETRGLLLALLGTLSASLGMLISAHNQRYGLPVIQTNAFGMSYGAALTTAWCLAHGLPFNFDPSFAYVSSLLYLAVFASVLAFWSYLTLVGRIGPGRAGYAAVLFPIIALTLSTLFEGYQWTSASIFGVAMVLVGNALVLGRAGSGNPLRRKAALTIRSV